MRGLARNATALLPMVGPVAQAGIESDGARVMESPAVIPPKALFRSFGAAKDIVAGEDPAAADVRALGVALTVLTGFPIHPISRAVGHDMDVESGKRRPDGAVEYARGLVLGS